MLSYVEFWIGTSREQRPLGSRAVLSASSRKAVEDFRAAPLADAATSNDAAGVQLDYAPDFSAACGREPDGD
jgi:hypothetical protein